MISIPACFDRESRGAFWRFAGQAFEFYRKLGATSDEARRRAVSETQKQIEACIKYTMRQENEQ